MAHRQVAGRRARRTATESAKAGVLLRPRGSRQARELEEDAFSCPGQRDSAGELALIGRADDDALATGKQRLMPLIRQTPASST